MFEEMQKRALIRITEEASFCQIDSEISSGTLPITFWKTLVVLQDLFVFYGKENFSWPRINLMKKLKSMRSWRSYANLTSSSSKAKRTKDVASVKVLWIAPKGFSSAGKVEGVAKMEKGRRAGSLSTSFEFWQLQSFLRIGHKRIFWSQRKKKVFSW